MFQSRELLPTVAGWLLAPEINLLEPSVRSLARPTIHVRTWWASPQVPSQPLVSTYPQRHCAPVKHFQSHFSDRCLQIMMLPCGCLGVAVRQRSQCRVRRRKPSSVIFPCMLIESWHWRSRLAQAACQCAEHGVQGAKHCARQWTRYFVVWKEKIATFCRWQRSGEWIRKAARPLSKGHLPAFTGCWL